jgi:hypothetical protein
MKKENENIHLHIIESNYKNLKKQPEQFDVSGKAELPEGLQKNQASVLKELGRMHEEFAVVMEPGWLQTGPETPEEQQTTDKSSNGLNAAELFSSLKNMKAEEQELLDRKQLLLGNLDKLKLLIIGEINKKQKSIEGLKSEVLELERTCKEISQALELSANLT